MKKIFFPFLIVIASCNNALNEKVENAMQQYDNYILHTNAKDIAAMFTTDGELTPPSGNRIHGKDSIEYFLSHFYNIKIKTQKSTTHSIRRFGDTAFQYGKYYQHAVVNNTTAEVHGMFQANWVIKPDGKLLLKKLRTWSTGYK